MSQSTSEVVVIGAGPAGYVCAIRLAQLGKKVTVIEKDEVGGVCLNRGCIPSKALIHAGSMLEKMSHVDEMGISVKDVNLDFKKLMGWKQDVVKKLTGGISQLLKANGCQVIQGDAKFTGSKSLEVKTATGVQKVDFQFAVIATGSRPAQIPGFDVDQKLIWDSTGGLSQQEKPSSLLCVGGGYIGMELGTFYSKIGTKVTIVEAAPSILGIVDADLVRVVQKRIEKRGVKVMTGTTVQSVKKLSNQVEVTFKSAAGELLLKMIEAMGIDHKNISLVPSIQNDHINNSQENILLCFGENLSQKILNTQKPLSELRGSYQESPTENLINTKIIATYHPQDCLKNPALKKQVWEDLKLVINYLK